MAQFAECLGFNLPNALPRHVELLPHLLQGPVDSISDPESHPHHFLLPRGKRGEQLPIISDFARCALCFPSSIALTLSRNSLTETFASCSASRMVFNAIFPPRRSASSCRLFAPNRSPSFLARELPTRPASFSSV